VIIFGYNHEERERKANVLKCKLRGLPKKYLGIPIFYKDSVVFTQKKIQVWWHFRGWTLKREAHDFRGQVDFD
jgi:hypothetical protein